MVTGNDLKISTSFNPMENGISIIDLWKVEAIFFSVSGGWLHWYQFVYDAIGFRIIKIDRMRHPVKGIYYHIRNFKINLTATHTRNTNKPHHILPKYHHNELKTVRLWSNAVNNFHRTENKTENEYQRTEVVLIHQVYKNGFPFSLQYRYSSERSSLCVDYVSASIESSC